MKLFDINIGETFKVAETEFIKFTEEDGKTFAVAKDSLFNSSFGNDGNLAESKLRAKLENELLAKIEAEVGADNVLEFETDMTALDGTKPFSDITSKISLPTLDFYRKHREIFGKYSIDRWWWLSTVDSESFKDIVLCVSPRGDFNYGYFNNDIGVRPILLFSSSISVSCN